MVILFETWISHGLTRIFTEFHRISGMVHFPERLKNRAITNDTNGANFTNHSCYSLNSRNSCFSFPLSLGLSRRSPIETKVLSQLSTVPDFSVFFRAILCYSVAESL